MKIKASTSVGGTGSKHVNLIFKGFLSVLYGEWKQGGWGRKAFLRKPHRKLTQEGEEASMGRSGGKSVPRRVRTRSAKAPKLDKPGVFLELGEA